MNKNNYTLEDLLVNDLKIYQDKSQYTFTSDSTILAQFIDVKPNEKIIEACSGSGVISILLTAKGANDITCFEIQKNLAFMSEQSVKINNLTDKIKIICDDFQNVTNYVNKVDTIVCNPPYYKSGKESLNDSIKKAKFETSMTLNDLIQTSAKILKDTGSFYICFTPDRTSELLYCLTKNKLQPKIMFFTQKDQGKNPSCVFVKAVKNGNYGIKVLPTLFTHDNDGKFILSTQELFKQYKNILQE